MTGPSFGRLLPADRFLISSALLIESKLNWIVIMDQPLLIILRQTETREEKVRNIHTMVAMLREPNTLGPEHLWGCIWIEFILCWMLIKYWPIWFLVSDLNQNTEGPRFMRILGKTVLHEIRVSGTVLWSPTNATSPTYTYISQKPC